MCFVYAHDANVTKENIKTLHFRTNIRQYCSESAEKHILPNTPKIKDKNAEERRAKAAPHWLCKKYEKGSNKKRS